MKKFLVTLSIVLMSMTMVFAEAGNGGVVKSNHTDLSSKSATSEVSLTVTEDQLVYYTFGFSDVDNATSPSNIGTITLDKINEDYTAQNSTSVYLYFDVRTKRNFDLTLTSDGKLHNNGSTKKLDYVVKIDSTPEINTGTPDLTWTASINDNGATANKTYQLDILTAAIPADGADTYTSTLTLTVRTTN